MIAQRRQRKTAAGACQRRFKPPKAPQRDNKREKPLESVNAFLAFGKVILRYALSRHCDKLTRLKHYNPTNLTDDATAAALGIKELLCTRDIPEIEKPTDPGAWA